MDEKLGIIWHHPTPLHISTSLAKARASNCIHPTDEPGEFHVQIDVTSRQLFPEPVVSGIFQRRIKKKQDK